MTINPLWTNATGGITLMVAKDRLEQAQDLLLQFNQEKRNNFTCPYCLSGNIEPVSSNKEPANWLSVLAGFLLFSYAMPVKNGKARGNLVRSPGTCCNAAQTPKPGINNSSV